LRGHRNRPAVFIHRYIDKPAAGGGNNLAAETALHAGFHLNRNTAAPDSDNFGEAFDQITHKHRIFKYNLLSGHGYNAASGAAARQNGAGQIHHRHQPAAENIAVRIGIRRHGNYFNGRLYSFGHGHESNANNLRKP